MTTTLNENNDSVPLLVYKPTISNVPWKFRTLNNDNQLNGTSSISCTGSQNLSYYTIIKDILFLRTSQKHIFYLCKYKPFDFPATLLKFRDVQYFQYFIPYSYNQFNADGPRVYLLYNLQFESKLTLIDFR